MRSAPQVEVADGWRTVTMIKDDAEKCKCINGDADIACFEFLLFSGAHCYGGNLITTHLFVFTSTTTQKLLWPPQQLSHVVREFTKRYLDFDGTTCVENQGVTCKKEKLLNHSFLVTSKKVLRNVKKFFTFSFCIFFFRYNFYIFFFWHNLYIFFFLNNFTFFTIYYFLPYKEFHFFFYHIFLIKLTQVISWRCSSSLNHVHHGQIQSNIDSHEYCPVSQHDIWGGSIQKLSYLIRVPS